MQNHKIGERKMMIDDLLKRLYVLIQKGYIHRFGLIRQQISTIESCTLYELACKNKDCLR